jgi:hypothetical protein
LNLFPSGFSAVAVFEVIALGSPHSGFVIVIS